MDPERAHTEYECPACHHRFHMQDYDYCPSCGSPLRAFVCRFCGYASPSDMGVCPRCGPSSARMSSALGFKFALIGSMLAGGFGGALQGIIISGAQFNEPTIGFRATLGMMIGGLLGVLIGGILGRRTIDSAGGKTTFALCLLGLIVGLGIGMALDIPQRLPQDLPQRALFAVLNAGCIGWFGGCILALFSAHFRK